MEIIRDCESKYKEYLEANFNDLLNESLKHKEREEIINFVVAKVYEDLHNEGWCLLRYLVPDNKPLVKPLSKPLEQEQLVKPSVEYDNPSFMDKLNIVEKDILARNKEKEGKKGFFRH